MRYVPCRTAVRFTFDPSYLGRELPKPRKRVYAHMQKNITGSETRAPAIAAEPAVLGLELSRWSEKCPDFIFWENYLGGLKSLLMPYVAR